MKLPVEHLVRVVGNSRARYSEGGGNRVAGRIPLAVEATLWRMKGVEAGEILLAEVEDLSVVGVGLLVDQRFYPGERFELKIAREGVTVLILRCAVKRCTRKADGRFKIGAEYVSFVAGERARTAG